MKNYRTAYEEAKREFITANKRDLYDEDMNSLEAHLEEKAVFLEYGEVVCRTRPCRCTIYGLEGNSVCGTCRGTGNEYEEVGFDYEVQSSC